MFKRRFIHCTGSLKAVLGILKNGFVIHPCDRKVLNFITNRPEFSRSEPQEFGMVCLHSFKVFPNFLFWRKYGPFGIEMKPSFVDQTGFRQVEYVSSVGTRINALRSRFEDAINDLDACVYKEHPEDGFRKMAYTNKFIAQLVGANKWSEFLSEFEYMEPVENRFEQEWRYSRQEPFYYDERSKKDVIDAVNDSQSWAKYSFALHFSKDDVKSLYAPFDYIVALRSQIPDEFKDIAIKRSSEI